MDVQQTRRDERIRVDKRIISLLSRSTYESFPRVLREMVSNSYDADATRVDMIVDIASDDIRVIDNGNGMDPDQFHYFLTIAGTDRMAKLTPRYKRERIGQFGVGFLAAFPFCNQMIVETTSASSTVVTKATIPCASYMKGQGSDTGRTSLQVEDIPVPILETNDPRKKNEHYTKIYLKGLTPLTNQYLTPTMVERQAKRSTKDWPSTIRLRWELQDTIVLDYPDDSRIARALGQPPVGMEVYLNNERLYRNEPPGEIFESKTKDFDGIRVRYVITSPWEPIYPLELRGLRVHVNNVGVGPRTAFGLAVQAGTLQRLYWLSGDVYIDEGGREYLALDREGFTNAPVIMSQTEYFRTALRHVNTILSEADMKLKEVESELGVPTRGGGPRPKLQVGSKRKLVDRRVSALEKEGFTVKRIYQTDMGASPSNSVNTTKPMSPERTASQFQARLIQAPVEIDRISREIRLYENHPDFDDTIHTSMGEFVLEYKSWDYAKSKYPACQMIGDRDILVNESYPLFNNKHFGRFFLRIAITLAVTSRTIKGNDDFNRMLLLKWVDEFRELIG